MVGMSDVAGGLLSGPWGRRLCVEVLKNSRGPAAWILLSPTASPAAVATELPGMITSAHLQTLGANTDPSTVFGPLAATVGAAAYWQPLDHLDAILGRDDVIEALVPVAEALSVSPANNWWDSPIPLGDHHRVLFNGCSAFAIDSARALEAWRANTLDDDQRAAERPTDPTAAWSGPWWSTPALSGLSHSTRSLSTTGPVGLDLVEDAMGWTAATVEHLSTGPDVRIFEIDGPGAWTELVARYPLSVTGSRRHDWWRITRRSGDWLIPDYQAIAVDYDAIHLTVKGYLSTAARALNVGSSAAVLAGWDPDATWWLTDSFHAETAARWSTSDHDQPLGWKLRAGCE